MFKEVGDTATIAVSGDKAEGVSDRLEVGDGLLMRNEGIVEKAVLMVHGAKVVVQLAFETDGLLGSLATADLLDALEETLGSFLGKALGAKLDALMVEILRFLEAGRLRGAGYQQERRD